LPVVSLRPGSLAFNPSRHAETPFNSASDAFQLHPPRRSLDPQYGYDGECLKKAEELGKPGLVDIRAKEDAFHFTVESTGALRPEEIVVNALKVLERKMEVTRGELDILEREQDEQVAM
jgi:hypothetical protein